MRIPFNWLKEFVDIKIPAAEIAEKVTMSGLEAFVVEHSKDGEPILEVDILPNRGDCNSVLGTAREVAAVLNLKVKAKKPKVKKLSKKSNSVIGVEVRDKKLCPRYMARVIEGVTVKDSPDWLKKRLIDSGLRPINNIVDVTNYYLLELGQPMHAFDYDLIEGKKIIVRHAAPKEKIKTLDNEERTLEKDALVIADSSRAIALAGIMGGANTEVSGITKTVVLESACFDPISIAKASKQLKLRTEASSRFEKTIDWNMVELALNQAAALIADLSGGKILSGNIDIKDKPVIEPTIQLRTRKMCEVLGADISKEKALKILSKLGFKVKKHDKKSINVQVPSWRIADIEREIDVIEEIARLYGYNNIPATTPKIRRTEASQSSISRISAAKEVLLGLGLFEVQTFSFVDPRDANEDTIKISNPMTISESAMRTSMLPSILKVISHNIRHQIDDIKIFEVGKVFGKKGSEKLVLAGGLCYPKSDFFELKGIVATLISEYSQDFQIENLANDWYNPNKSAAITVNGNPVARFGLLHPEISKKYDLNKDIFAFEVDLENLFKSLKYSKYSELPKFPKVERDIAMFVPDGVAYEQIISLIKESAGALLEEVKLFDVYKNSQAYRLSFRSKSTTLTDEKVNELFSKVIKSLEEKLMVQIRK